jgi:hypothetical protein
MYEKEPQAMSKPKARGSVHPFEIQVIKLRQGHVFPTFQTLGLHPGLYGAMHPDFLSLFTKWFWNLAPVA